MVGVQLPVQGFALRTLGFQRICEPGGQEIVGIRGYDQQPSPGVGVPRGGQFALLPVDRQQAFGQHTLAGVALGDAATQLQPTHDQQQGPVLVEYVEIGFCPGPVHPGHPAQAVAGVLKRAVAA